MSRKHKDTSPDSTLPVPPPISDPVLSPSPSADVTSPGAMPPDTTATLEISGAPDPAASVLPPAWTPSADHYLPPDWVIRAQRFAWQITDIDAEWKRVFDENLPAASAHRGQWTSNDIEYSYFAGGKVLARFRNGGFGVLKTSPLVEAFEPKPEPEAPAESPTA